jgi:hypothetical protein
MDFRESTHEFVADSSSAMAIDFKKQSEDMMKEQLPNQQELQCSQHP